jgi:predicted dehydrogenase
MGVRHIEAVKQLGMNLVGAVDISEATLESARTRFSLGVGACFTDVSAMLRAVRPQALVVATTAPTHAQYVLAGVEHGVRYILCEKPMATSLTDADAMIAACRRSGTALAVNHQMRFIPQWFRIKELIGTEELGELASIIVAGSNFGLAMNAGHYFEAFRYLTDGPVRKLQAWFESEQLANPRGPQFEDRSGRLLAWGEGNLSMFIDFSVGAGHGLTSVYLCRQGQVSVDELSGDVRIVARKGEYRPLPTTRYAMPAEVRHLALEAFDTVAPTMAVWSAMLEGGSYPDGTTGLHALTCLVAAHVSHESGGRDVHLDDPLLPRQRVFKWA